MVLKNPTGTDTMINDFLRYKKRKSIGFMCRL